MARWCSVKGQRCPNVLAPIRSVFMSRSVLRKVVDSFKEEKYNFSISIASEDLGATWIYGHLGCSWSNSYRTGNMAYVTISIVVHSIVSLAMLDAINFKDFFVVRLKGFTAFDCIMKN